MLPPEFSKEQSYETSESNWEKSSSTTAQRYSEVSRENSESRGDSKSNTFGETKTITTSIGCSGEIEI